MYCLIPLGSHYLYIYVSILFQEFEARKHLYAVKIPQFLAAVPSHLLFDLEFLQFFLGKRMFPNSKKNFYSHTDLFPELAMPTFRVTCLLRIFDEQWAVDYACACSNPYSLFCSSLATVAVEKWVRDILDYLRPQQDQWLVEDFRGLEPEWWNRSLWCKLYNPISCLFYILSHRTTIHNYALEKTRTGYILYIQPPYFHSNVHRAIECLRELKRRLPFTLQIVCFPFIKV